MIMATHGFNDGHHWLSNGLSHVMCHANICHAMYLSIGVWETHYAKLSQAMRAPWVDRFFNNEIYCYPLSKKRCRPSSRSPTVRRSEGIVTSGRQQRNETIYIWIAIHGWRFFVFSEHIGNCGLQNIDYKILLIIIPFNWYFCSVI